MSRRKPFTCELLERLARARPGRLDPAWADANLLRVWREFAPKLVLKAFDAARGVTP